MSAWPVNIVSAFGRGETLALALQEHGFDVQVLDFTAAFGEETNHGVGPFPIAERSFLPEQKALLEEARSLPRGLTLWLREGPIELGGPMAEHFENTFESVRLLKKNAVSSDFEHDWLRRLMRLWASPYNHESWKSNPSSPAFPFGDLLGVVPASKENRVMSFERYQTLEHKYIAAKYLRDVQFEGSRLTEVEVDAGGVLALRAPQWIWCLSSEETETLGPDVSAVVFSKGVRKSEWRWINFHGRCDRGSWSAGFPEYTLIVGDIHLPFTYTNLIVFRWVDVDHFQAWIKVPAASMRKAELRAEWAEEIRRELFRRLPQASWSVDAKGWSMCPHSTVFDETLEGEGLPVWKNWDWIAPETLPRLDLSARLQREAQAFDRLVQWKNEQMKKQGARGDHALHAP